MREWIFGIITFIVVGLFLFLAVLAGEEHRKSEKKLLSDQIREEIQAEATKAGVAYYELNQQTGKIEFKYVDINQVVRSVIQQVQQQMRQVQSEALQ